MSIGLIFVMETSAPGKSDHVYIQTVLDHFFIYKDVTILNVFLDGKRNYSSKKTLSIIGNYQSMLRSQAIDSSVIYFIDTDSASFDYDQGSFFSNVSSFCKTKGFGLVWFCKNVENVFLGKEANAIGSKLKAAKDFVRTSGINSIPKTALSQTAIKANGSNILLILSKYLPLKG